MLVTMTRIQALTCAVDDGTYPGYKLCWSVMMARIQTTTCAVDNGAFSG